MDNGKKPISGTIVDLGATLMGRLDTDQSLYVRGIFEGALKVSNTVFINRDGQISADVTAERVVVQGIVIGNIHAEQVIIYASGQVWGDVCAQTLYVEAGGFLRGQAMISHESEPRLYPQTPDSFDNLDILPIPPSPDDDLTHSSVEPEVDVHESLVVDDPTDQPMHTTIEPHTIQQDDVQAEANEALPNNTQPIADLETIQDVQLIEQEETETPLSQADLETNPDEIEEEQDTYIAYCLICRTYRPIAGAHQLTLPNGRRVVKGHCGVCGIRFLEQLHSE